MNGEFFTAEEIAKKLAVTPAYVDQLLETGKLQGRKLGSGSWQISKTDLANFMKRQ